MHIVYMDDSRDEEVCVFTALAIPATQWHASLRMIQEYRRTLNSELGMFVRKELHAHKFVNGRGRYSRAVLTKRQRLAVYNRTLKVITTLPDAHLFNAVYHRKARHFAFGALLNRVNRTMKAWSSYSVLVCDEGNEGEYTALSRRMSRYNPIPSDRGAWEDSGKPWKNIPLDRIIEDPVFRDSSDSAFIQLADFAAYALLQRERPRASKTLFGLHKSFDILGPILFRGASRKDPEGIIRPKRDPRQGRG